MTTELDRIEGLISQRVESRRRHSRLRADLGGLYFSPRQHAERARDASPDYRRDSWTVAELLRFYDRDFVQNAYLVLLKRNPDVEGLGERLSALRNGDCSRSEMLFRLRYGPEGKEHKVKVRGLLRAFALDKICGIPVLGVVPSSLRALVYLPRMQRDIEELRGLIAKQQSEFDEETRAITDFQNEELAKIIEYLER